MGQKFNVIVKCFIDGKWEKGYVQTEVFKVYSDYKSERYDQRKIEIKGTLKFLVDNDGDITEMFMEKR